MREIANSRRCSMVSYRQRNANCSPGASLAMKHCGPSGHGFPRSAPRCARSRASPCTTASPGESSRRLRRKPLTVMARNPPLPLSPRSRPLPAQAGLASRAPSPAPALPPVWPPFPSCGCAPTWARTRALIRCSPAIRYPKPSCSRPRPRAPPWRSTRRLRQSVLVPMVNPTSTSRRRRVPPPASRRRRGSRITSWRTVNIPGPSRAAWHCWAWSPPIRKPRYPWNKMPMLPQEPQMLRDSKRRDSSRALFTKRNAASVAAFTLLMGAGVAFSAEPKEWLERMNKALTTQNYVGVFTHVQGGRVETLRIIHRVRGRDVSERLLSLDGSGREFIREGNELTCYFPDKRTVLVERRSPDGPLLGALPSIGDDDSLVYEIRGGERERLLGRTTRVVALHPRDEYRYGYRLWIDEETSMPLKTQLCDQSGEVIEQIVFSTIDLP